jgi:hypothetical protein
MSLLRFPAGLDRWGSRLSLILLLLVGAMMPRPGRAQVGSTTDIITGTITGPDGRPLAGARVEAVSVETQTRRGRNTGNDGKFTILFPDGGGQYHITVRYLGMAPVQRTIAREADEDRFVLNIAMTANPTQLGPVIVNAARTPQRNERPEPGTTERVVNGDQLSRMPIDASDPNALAALSPGVVSLTPSDSTAAGFSIAGQRPDLNNVTVDGANFGGGGVPAEAIRQTRVITSTYDIARGQFTGGQISTTTRGGTNQMQGTFSYNLRDPNLEFREEELEGGFSQSFTQHSFSGGFGGPIKQDKIFFFASGQLRRRIDPMQSLLAADDRSLERLGASPDSAARFRELAEGYGVPSSVARIPSDRTADNLFGMARLDWQLDDSHSLMFRGDLRASLTDAFRVTPLAVPSHGGDQESSGGGAMISLSSTIGTYINELRAYANKSNSSSSPFLEMPEGRVRVSSVLPDGATGVTTLEFGGSTALPTDNRSSQFELANELSWISGTGAHRFKLGAFLTANTFAQSSGNNRLGSFTYNSLADFAANQPASFTRSLTPRERNGGTTDAAIYLGDTWRHSRALQVTYGARIEGSAYRGRPQYNPMVEEVFGRRTDHFPREISVSPRVGFTWNLGAREPQRRDTARAGAERQREGRQAGGGGGGGGGGRSGRRGIGANIAGGGGGPGLILRGGIGQFRGRAPTGLFSSAIDATGLPSGERQLVCIGPAVPIPDWTAWTTDQSTIPMECAEGGSGTSPFSTQRPNVTVFDPDFGSPKSVRTSLGVSRRFMDRYNISLDLSYALGTSLYGVTDLNLDRTAAFTIDEEGGRPVYVAPTSIVSSTGATSVLGSRKNESFAHVFEVDSRFRSHSRQMTVSLSGLARPAIFFNVSYTLSSARDQSSFSGGGSAMGGFSSATTDGDPTVREWSRSDFDRRHSLVGSLTWPAKPWIDVTAIGRLSSGSPYTPRVGGDINGDGARNDRAFIFAATAGMMNAEIDTGLTNGMARLVDVASSRARECLERQTGRIASRNSCSGPWYPSLDLQANFRPFIPGLIGRRLQLSVSTMNLLAGIDQLFHGADDLRGWGQPARTDGTLLYVRGFDPQRQAFIYQVNERFGDTRGSRSAFFAPFQIGVQARLQVGRDRQREMMQQMVQALRDTSRRAAGAANRGGGGQGGFNIRGMLERAAPNPATAVLARREELQLTAQQVTRLEGIRDSLQARMDSTLDAVARQAERASTPAELMNQVRPRMEQARTEYQASIRVVESALTPEQWAKVPATIKNPPALNQGQQQRGGQARPRTP